METAFIRLSYRIQQALRYVTDRPAPDDRAFVADLLPPALLHLFRRMSSGDQAHAIRVCRRLRKRGIIERAVLQAALLHDVGKAPGIPFLYRVSYVLLHRLTPGIAERLVATPTPRWRRPFYRLAHHPRIGAQLAKEAGAAEDVVTIIRAHQEGVTDADVPARLHPMLATLREIDDMS